MSEKKRILYCAWTLPQRGGGAVSAMFRHFVLHDDFEFSVISDTYHPEPPYPYLHFPRPRWMQRAMSTRIARMVRNFEIVTSPRRYVGPASKVVESFKPDAIFTIPDNTLSWTAYLLARKYDIPLITDYQDWWPRGQYFYPLEEPYEPVRKHLEKRFQTMFTHSKLVFCTSQGMKDYLGDHPNSHVLLPICERTETEFNPVKERAAGAPFRIVYTGTASGSYGQMLLSLIRKLENRSDIELIIYGPKPDWPEAVYEPIRDKGIHRGFLQFDKLVEVMKEADALLSVMSFEPRLDIMARTSFTTKLLDYSRFSRPMILWAPEYSSPARLLREREAAVLVERDDPDVMVQQIDAVKDDFAAQARLGKQAYKLSQEDFHHDTIHAVLKDNIHKTLASA